MANNIANKLTYSGLSKQIHNKLSLLVVSLLENKQYLEKTIDAVTAEKYRHNMYGLFKNVIDIPEEQIQVNILLNGYINSSDYNGEILNIKCADTSVVGRYITQLVITEKEMNKQLTEAGL